MIDDCWGKGCPNKFIFPSQNLLILGKGMKADFVACILHRKIVCCPVQNNHTHTEIPD